MSSSSDYDTSIRVLEDFVCQAVPPTSTKTRRRYNKRMKTLERPLLDKVMDPLASILTREMADRLARFRFDQKTQREIDKLACKCNEGRLTESERREYEAYVYAIDFIAILQAKARALLKRSADGR